MSCPTYEMKTLNSYTLDHLMHLRPACTSVSYIPPIQVLRGLNVKISTSVFM